MPYRNPRFETQPAINPRFQQPQQQEHPPTQPSLQQEPLIPQNPSLFEQELIQPQAFAQPTQPQPQGQILPPGLQQPQQGQPQRTPGRPQALPSQQQPLQPQQIQRRQLQPPQHRMIAQGGIQQTPQSMPGQAQPQQGSPFQAPSTLSPFQMQGSPGFPQARQEVIRQPAVDLFDAGDNLIAEIEIPGAKKDEVRLTVVGDRIQLHAPTQQHQEDESVLQSERGHVTYQREILLNTPVEPEDIEATFEDGILKVEMPKTNPSSGPKRINIS